jgi:hypothetical protein
LGNGLAVAAEAAAQAGDFSGDLHNGGVETPDLLTALAGGHGLEDAAGFQCGDERLQSGRHPFGGFAVRRRKTKGFG